MQNTVTTAPDVSAAAAEAVATAATISLEHARPAITDGMTAAQYVETAQKLHDSQYKKKGPPKWLRWIGDGALSVFPINRISSAIGLTTGLFIGGALAKTLTGADFHHGTIDKLHTPTFLHKLHGKIKFDPKALDSKNRWIGYGMWGLFAAGGMIGVKTGTWFAYRNMYKKNRNPAYLEDYVARVSQHHGDFWAWLCSFGGVFGTASGNFVLPIPGLNYGSSLAFRATDMKDENLMLPGIGKVLSGSTTTLKYGVREGLEELCRYAINNPAKTPTDLEYYAYTVLGQIFDKQLKPEHIEHFVGAVHTIRDKYWQEGGIPKDMKKKALAELHTRFTKNGFETLLEDIGLDSMQIDFLALKGFVGKISNLATKSGVMQEQKEFREKLTARREARLQKTEEKPMENAEIRTPAPEAKSFATADFKKPSAASLPRPASHQERANTSAGTATLGA